MRSGMGSDWPGDPIEPEEDDDILPVFDKSEEDEQC